MVEGRGQRLRALEALDQSLKDLDFELGDFFRRQTVRIRETRAAVAKIKTEMKAEMKGAPQED